MMTRMLLATVLSLSVFPAAASDVSPFYRNQFVVTERESCATSSARASGVSPFYKTQFAVTKAESCAALAAKDAAAARSEETDQQRRAAAQGFGHSRS